MQLRRWQDIHWKNRVSVVAMVVWAVVMLGLVLPASPWYVDILCWALLLALAFSTILIRPVRREVDPR